MPNYGQEMQLEIYSSAVAGKRIDLPYDFDEWERRAREALPETAYWYIAGASGMGNTMRANREAFDRVKLHNRVLNDVSTRDISTEVLGRKIPAPFLLAPIGVQGIMHPDGEKVPATACAATGIPFVISTVSSVPMEQVAQIMGDSPRWFQLYPARSRDVAQSMVSRAEKSGYEAIVVTLDTPALGWRGQDLRLGYLPFLEGKGIANYLTDPVFRSLLAKPPEEDPRAAIMQFLAVFTNPTFGWSDVDWLRSITKLPILLKGVVHPDDVRKAIDHGVSGVVVSNHGGRQLDGVPGSIRSLPEVVAAVGNQIEVLVDGGIRNGGDIVKALSLGARAVLIGRAYAYGLSAAGEAGVDRAIEILRTGMIRTMKLLGVSSVRELNRSYIDVPAGWLPRD